MNGDSRQRSVHEAWLELLEKFQPPHSDSDPYTPSMWILLQTASRDPLLCTLYPGLSTTMLTFSQFDEFHLREGEQFPVIGAAAGEFGVSAYPVTEDNLLLVTSDPGQAVTLAARLIRDQLEGTTPPDDRSTGPG